MGYLDRIIHLRDGSIEKDKKSKIMKLEFKLAFKNLFGAKLRTLLNVLFFHFPLLL